MHQPVETPRWFVYSSRRKQPGFAYFLRPPFLAGETFEFPCTVLLGPYGTRAEACANIPRAEELSRKTDLFSVFYEFGTLADGFGRVGATCFGA